MLLRSNFWAFFLQHFYFIRFLVNVKLDPEKMRKYRFVKENQSYHDKLEDAQAEVTKNVPNCFKKPNFKILHPQP